MADLEVAADELIHEGDKPERLALVRVSRPMMNEILDLPPDVGVVRAVDDHERDAITLIVAGEGLPEECQTAPFPAQPLKVVVPMYTLSDVGVQFSHWANARKEPMT